ncbi:molybdopterin-dependent oxidoreductase [Nocardioides perillae]|uniref:Oxidoreductase molybdopterin-binding domain-containing protein n=1 Tax=Nocardioides perillae TaxID=1119534 RepID=A0A7Y9RVI4_9ACTN|nr:hypothetical protein [Nocardioides perillae]
MGRERTTDRSSGRPRLLPREDDFTSPLHSHRVAARVGVWLAAAFGVCFLTGLVSHYAQETSHPVPFPTSPAWGYRVTQGLHVVTGAATVPLLLVKLWTVYPRFWQRLPRPGPHRTRRLLLTGVERASVAVLVATAVFQLASGLANSAQWYPFAFSFRPTHYAVAWVAVGSIVLHVAVKLPLVRDAFAGPVDVDEDPGPGPERPTRRGLLRATGVAAGLTVLATAGQSVPGLRRISVLATTDGDGPQGLPVNTTAAEADVVARATSGGWVLEVVRGERSVRLTLAELAALPQRTETLPIACVEGWSASGTWTGVRVRDLVALVGGSPEEAVTVTSLQPEGPFRTSVLQPGFVDDGRTLLALRLEGAPLALDHGFPARVIAPNRPGVLQTKWVGRLEVQA